MFDYCLIKFQNMTINKIEVDQKLIAQIKLEKKGLLKQD